MLPNSYNNRYSWDKNQVLDSSFWENAWQEMEQKGKKKRGSMAGVETWNKRADNFTQNVESREGSSRTEAVLNFLKREGALQQGFTVIDIGSGPGTITIPLAKEASFVVALEPAEAMLHKLQERAALLPVENIQTVAERWQDTDLEKRGWRNFFDLSFASMSPGIAGPKDLRKLIDSSRRYCYLSTFAGRKDETRDTLWKELLGEDYPTSELNVIYPFNLLYSWGYRPNLRFFHHRQSDWLPVEKVAANMKQYLQGRVDVDSKIEEKIYGYLEKLAKNGQYFYRRESFQGMLIWDKNICFAN